MRVNWRLRVVPKFTKECVISLGTSHTVQALICQQRIEHAGYQRDIISRNPPLIDEDGYEVDSDDDDERAQAAIAAATELDPYSGVKIEGTHI